MICCVFPELQLQTILVVFSIPFVMLEVENFKPFELSTILWHLGHNHGCATAGRWVFGHI